jgi:hypothetical protein
MDVVFPPKQPVPCILCAKQRRRSPHYHIMNIINITPSHYHQNPTMQEFFSICTITTGHHHHHYRRRSLSHPPLFTSASVQTRLGRVPSDFIKPKWISFR